MPTKVKKEHVVSVQEKVAALTAEEKEALRRQFAQEARDSALAKRAEKEGITLDELHAQMRLQNRRARAIKWLRENHEDRGTPSFGITEEMIVERLAQMGTGGGGGRKSNGDGPTGISVSVPANLAPEKQLERIERAMARLAERREELQAEVAGA